MDIIHAIFGGARQPKHSPREHGRQPAARDEGLLDSMQDLCGVGAPQMLRRLGMPACDSVCQRLTVPSQ